ARTIPTTTNTTVPKRLSVPTVVPHFPPSLFPWTARGWLRFNRAPTLASASPCLRVQRQSRVRGRCTPGQGRTRRGEGAARRCAGAVVFWHEEDATMILVTGATGTNGRLVAQALLAAGARVRAMVQDSSRAADLARAGAELAVADFDRTETLDRALAGAER